MMLGDWTSISSDALSIFLIENYPKLQAVKIIGPERISELLYNILLDRKPELPQFIYILANVSLSYSVILMDSYISRSLHILADYSPCCTPGVFLIPGGTQTRNDEGQKQIS